MRKITTCLAIAGLIWAGPALAQQQPRFLSASQIDAAVILQPPPADDSPQTKTELAEVKRLAHDAKPERMERARLDDRTEEISIFTEILGYEITEATHPKTWKMFRDVRYEETVAVNYAKSLFKRSRPYELDRTIEHCALAQPGTSYPSGHANYIFATATVMAALAPQKATLINARADEFAESRLICGMHYRGDIVAGKKLGTVVGSNLLKNATFKAEFDEAVAEIAAGGSKAAASSAPAGSKLPGGGGGITEKGKALGLGAK